MSSLKVFAFPAPFNARLVKILVAAAYGGLKIEVVSPEDVKDMEAYKANCHPLGAFPSMQTEQGYLFESGAILRYVGRLAKEGNLYGSTDFEAASIDSFMDLVTSELDCSVVSLAVNKLGFFEEPADKLKEYQATVMSVLTNLDAWLETRTFLVAERISLADCQLFATIDMYLRLAEGAGEAYKLKNVIRFYMTMLHQPKVLEVLKSLGGDCTLPAKPKVEAPKKEEKPKAEKPKKEAKPAEEDDFGEPQPEKKKPNPLDLLPPTPFGLDAFKREYSNNDTRKVAAPYFFDKFDPAGWSAFWCVYKYNEENKMQFMTANLVRGWFQRMDHVRKYGFGVVHIVGEDTKHDIVGFWFFRGKGMPQIVQDVDDTELFTWTEIPDLKAEAAKITDYLAWDGEAFKDKPLLEGRTFK